MVPVSRFFPNCQGAVRQRRSSHTFDVKCAMVSRSGTHCAGRTPNRPTGKLCRRVAAGILLGGLVALSGCQKLPKVSEMPTPGEIAHNLKPHRMWRLNRTSAAMSREAYFSVPDPLPAEERDD